MAKYTKLIPKMFQQHNVLRKIANIITIFIFENSVILSLGKIPLDKVRMFAISIFITSCFASEMDLIFSQNILFFFTNGQHQTLTNFRIRQIVLRTY